MKCARCGKPLDKAAAFVGGNPIGPKCWDKMRDKPTRIPRICRLSHGDDQDTLDLFGENETWTKQQDLNHSGKNGPETDQAAT
jgi:hypothetical protein